ncbi:MAG: tRNA (adenosine(37)-N6)-threonylcarbamoyltransferase complex dimerization subunit type 1 TsaB [Bacteroidaceae bacterium]|jgi:tRNA threonylcarbamoyladenosine biosynthesis protein TsaB|nr:tRNA (adenosine(37)-N6)-threonylcarbamoyltransferase complex dimerization subunit type 1 TsaB [Bacteroidaceae bacterium]
MATILSIETSTEVCSVAVAEDNHVIYHEEDFDGPSHAVNCGVFTQNALSFAESHAIPLDAVAVSEGPGSYTGLRIGVSMAKGVAYGRNIPLINVPTLELLCVPVLLYHEEIPDNSLLVPMIDARRMEVYAAIYDRSLHCLRGIQADIVDAETYKDYLERGPVVFFGNGSAKCKEIIKHTNAIFVQDINPLASNMAPLAEQRIRSGRIADTAYFEPFYLKDFHATKPKKLI